MSKEVADSKNLIEDFISNRVAKHGLDRRTEKAYRLDLEHFYAWAEQRRTDKTIFREKIILNPEKNGWEDWMEAYLEYLNKERKLSHSTLYRKNKVLGYYLSYLAKKGVISEYRSLKPIKKLKKEDKGSEASQGFLTKKEADAFFKAMNQEYERLDSEFRKRVCLRDTL